MSLAILTNKNAVLLKWNSLYLMGLLDRIDYCFLFRNIGGKKKK